MGYIHGTRTRFGTVKYLVSTTPSIEPYLKASGEELFGTYNLNKDSARSVPYGPYILHDGIPMLMAKLSSSPSTEAYCLLTADRSQFAGYYPSNKRDCEFPSDAHGLTPALKPDISSGTTLHTVVVNGTSLDLYLKSVSGSYILYRLDTDLVSGVAVDRVVHNRSDALILLSDSKIMHTSLNTLRGRTLLACYPLLTDLQEGEVVEKMGICKNDAVILTNKRFVMMDMVYDKEYQSEDIIGHSNLLSVR